MSKHSNDASAPRRRQAIVEIVQGGTVRSQGELQRLLHRRGIAVTQPTLSRDVRDLGLVKTPRGYVAPDVGAAAFSPAPVRESRFYRALRSFALSVRPAGSLVVVRTPPAGAQPVARAIDDAALPTVVGTVAGDDTVFVATLSDRAASALARRLAAAVGQHGVGIGA